jgi:opacity protein-like surface antigen
MPVFFRALSILLFLAFAVDAHAQFSRGYVGGAVASSKMNYDSNSIQIQNATASSLSTDSSSTGFKVYAGGRFHPNFGVEGGIVYYGSFTATRTVTAPAPGSLRSEIDVTGIYGDLVGFLPVGSRVDLFAKVGLIATGANAKRSTTGAVTIPGDQNGAQSEAGLHLGLGAEFLVADHFAIRLEYEQAQKVGDTMTMGSGNINAIFLGGTYRF